ncbi:MAG: C1 family peptidase [Bacteroidetes bacterium]|nr:C1 family peptidase [Bacteroidota bacterium]MBU1719926.1 C1 family peptidase [Bacteroidota bacterium]
MIIRILFASILIIGIQNFTSAQENLQPLSPENLKQIKEKTIIDAQTKAIINAVSSNDLKKVAKNQDNQGKQDHLFSNRVKTKGISDQKSSGRCWLFTGLNVMRPKVIQKYELSDFEFSQVYCFFYDQLEKANLFLEGIISTASLGMDDRKVDWLFKNPIGDGGQWTGVVNIIEKYGVVPADVMPETYHSENTSMLSRLLSRLLRGDGLELRDLAKKGKKTEDLRKEKIRMLTDVYRVLVVTLGQPVENFSWRYTGKDGIIVEMKEMTPLAFYKEAVGVDLKEYVMLMDDPSREYNQVYEIEFDRHTADGANWKYINLPAATIKEFAKASLLDNEAMYFSCDVGKQLDNENGFLDVNNYDYESALGVKFTMTKAQRIMTSESSSSHGMALVGVDLDANGNPMKWLLENSWGAKSGHQGHLTMTDRWFDEYMFRIVILKKFITPEVLKILEKKPIVLPPWDPMFAPEE